MILLDTNLGSLCRPPRAARSRRADGGADRAPVAPVGAQSAQIGAGIVSFWCSARAAGQLFGALDHATEAEPTRRCGQPGA